MARHKRLSPWVLSNCPLELVFIELSSRRLGHFHRMIASDQYHSETPAARP
jgi:hypothetical protein